MLHFVGKILRILANKLSHEFQIKQVSNDDDDGDDDVLMSVCLFVCVCAQRTISSTVSLKKT